MKVPTISDGQDQDGGSFHRVIDAATGNPWMGPMTLTQAAGALGVLPATLRQQIARGKLAATKRGRDWWVTKGEVERYRRDSRRLRTEAAVRINAEFDEALANETLSPCGPARREETALGRAWGRREGER